MRLLLIIGLVCLGYYVFVVQPQNVAPTSKETRIHDVTLDEARQLIFSKPGRKVVAVGASWCPACRSYIPQLAEARLPEDVSRYVLLIDNANHKASGYAKNTGGPIQWMRVTGCTDQYCTNLKGAFSQKLGLTYDSFIPVFAVYDAANRNIAQNLPVDTIACTLDGSCRVTCNGAQGCRVQRLR